MGKTVKIDDLAEEVMKGLTEYSKLATADMKKAVKKAGNDVRKEIQSTAPKETGAYAKSWAVKTTRESAEKLEVTVHSKNRYQLAHLLSDTQSVAVEEPKPSRISHLPKKTASTHLKRQ